MVSRRSSSANCRSCSPENSRVLEGSNTWSNNGVEDVMAVPSPVNALLFKCFVFYFI